MVPTTAYLLQLRLSSWEDQAGVIQAISAISMKLGQNEGHTKKTSQTKWVGFRICLKPTPFWFWGPNPQNGPKLAVKSENSPDHRIQTIYYHFFPKKDWSFSSIPQQFQVIQIDRCKSRAVNTHACHAKFCYHEI